MKNLKTKSLFKLLVVSSLFAFSITSCKDDNIKLITPAYVGTWSLEQTDSTTGNTGKITYTFTEKTFDNNVQLLIPSTKKYTDFVRIKGNMTVADSVMTIKVTQYGMDLGLIFGQSTGINLLSDGDEGFSDFASSVATKTIFKVSGNKITLKSDNNNDGIYSESDGEIYTLTKQ